MVFTCTLLVRMKNQKYENDLVWIVLTPSENIIFIEFLLPFPISLTLIWCGTIASNLAGWAGFLFGNVYAPFQKNLLRDPCNEIATTGNSLSWVCLSFNVINVGVKLEIVGFTWHEMKFDFLFLQLLVGTQVPAKYLGEKKWCEALWRTEISKYTRKNLGSLYAIWEIYVIFLFTIWLYISRLLWLALFWDGTVVVVEAVCP